MKIFFGFSPRFVTDNLSVLQKIDLLLDKQGHKNLNTLPILRSPEGFYNLTESELQKVHIKHTRAIKSADILIIETSIHSLTMGFYVKMALDLDKPVILLHQPSVKPFYFSAIQNDRLQIVEYTVHNIDNVIRDAIEYAKDSLDIRFNLMINSEINEYLKWASKKTHVARSSFVRNLILEHKKTHLNTYEEDMKK